MNRVAISVLRASWALGPVAYGRTIKDWIGKYMDGASYARIYVAIEELERLKMITTHHGDPTPERGGRAKRFVTLTDLGMKTIAALANEHLLQSEERTK